MPPADVSAAERYAVYSRREVAGIEAELKDWFLQRRFAMERGVAMKKALDGSNFTGLSIASPAVPEAQRALWADLVQGKPELEDSLSANARQMKADMYLKTFRDATDYDHPCRVPGSEYLQCVQSGFKDASAGRQAKCAGLFGTFDACRKTVLQQQAQALETSLVKQDIADRRAKALFERRSILLGAQAK
mmetsp:Transcript_76916/g.213096  ORF Transcript_76916/g.213096 Transcript_76916/m.213096 type:complete len:190 (-) Transcript_76916:101-670(-)